MIHRISYIQKKFHRIGNQGRNYALLVFYYWKLYGFNQAVENRFNLMLLLQVWPSQLLSQRCPSNRCVWCDVHCQDGISTSPKGTANVNQGRQGRHQRPPFNPWDRVGGNVRYLCKLILIHSYFKHTYCWNPIVVIIEGTVAIIECTWWLKLQIIILNPLALKENVWATSTAIYYSHDIQEPLCVTDGMGQLTLSRKEVNVIEQIINEKEEQTIQSGYSSGTPKDKSALGAIFNYRGG